MFRAYNKGVFVPGNGCSYVIFGVMTQEHKNEVRRSTEASFCKIKMRNPNI